jgi:hypothetical protein
MPEQWQDPRKTNRRQPGTRRAIGTRRGIGTKGIRRPSRRLPQGEEGEEQLAPPPKSNTTLYVIIGAAAAIILVVIIAATAGSGGGGRRGPAKRNHDRGYDYSSPADVYDSTPIIKKGPQYVPPPNVSTGDCGSIRGICKPCQWETDIALCADQEGCRGRNLFFFHKDKQVFVCYRCGKDSPPVRCEKCGGPLWKPKTKAR